MSGDKIPKLNFLINQETTNEQMIKQKIATFLCKKMITVQPIFLHLEIIKHDICEETRTIPWFLLICELIQESLP